MNASVLFSLIPGIIAALLSGTAILAGLPPHTHGSLIWLALAPLIITSGLPGTHLHPKKYYLIIGGIAGLIHFGGSLWWISYVTLPGTIVLVLYLSLYTTIWLWAHAWMASQLKSITSINHLLLGVWSASVWVVLEWIRGLLFSGFGWNGLAITQYDTLPVLHFVSWGGLGFVSGLIVFINVVLACVIHRFWVELKGGRGVRRHADFYAAIVLLMFLFVCGLRSSLEKRELSRGPLRLACVQANIPQSEKYQPDAGEVLQRHIQLSETAIAMKPDLLLWPETATGQVYSRNIMLRGAVEELVKKGDFTFVFGALGREDSCYYNSVYCLGPGGSPEESYRKLHLVPFGEYAPGAKQFPFMRYLVPFVIDFVPGDKPARFQVTRGGWIFTPLICFEDTVPSLVRDAAQDGVELLVNFTNDGWFADSPGAEQHWANAKVRALELDMPLIRCTNTGVTGIVGQSGRTEALLSQDGKKVGVEGVLFSEFKWSPPRKTLYKQFGDWPVIASGIILLCGWAFARYDKHFAGKK